jgi:hypothetical protein
VGPVGTARPGAAGRPAHHRPPSGAGHPSAPVSASPTVRCPRSS